MSEQYKPGFPLFTLRVSLATAFMGVVILALLCFGAMTFFSIRSFVRESVRQRLGDAVGIAALQINGDAHAKLRTLADEDSPEYREIRTQLRNIRAKVKDLRFVYTMRKNEEGKIIFVVDAEEDPKEMSHLVDVYEDASALMRQAFCKPCGIYVEKEFYTDKWGTFLSAFAPILKKDGEIDGLLCMDIAAQNVIDYERQYLLVLLVICISSSLAVALVGVLFSRRISKPLMLLEADMSRIRNLELDNSPVIRSRIVEVIKMKTALENMKSGLRSFRKYVPAELVGELIKLQKEADLNTEKRELSIFFSDITDFASISEKLSPEQLSQNMSLYFETMSCALMQNKATVDKYIGDAIMAFWGAPAPLQNHALLACRAALQCQERLKMIAADFIKAGMPPFITRIGISTGEAIVGNMGYRDRLNYTAIGDNVNLASRLENLNKHYGTSILISEATYLGIKDDFIVRPIDFVAVKGKSEGVKIYELLCGRDDAGKDVLDFVSLCEEAFRFYLRKDWAAASSRFASALKLRPDDKASQILLERCISYEKSPPPPEWNGVTVMQEK